MQSIPCNGSCSSPCARASVADAVMIIVVITLWPIIPVRTLIGIYICLISILIVQDIPCIPRQSGIMLLDRFNHLCHCLIGPLHPQLGLSLIFEPQQTSVQSGGSNWGSVTGADTAFTNRPLCNRCFDHRCNRLCAATFVQSGFCNRFCNCRCSRLRTASVTICVTPL